MGFTDDEMDALICAFLGDEPVSEEEIEKFVDWAWGQRVGGALIDLLIAGRVRARPDPEASGDYVFTKT